MPSQANQGVAQSITVGNGPSMDGVSPTQAKVTGTADASPLDATLLVGAISHLSEGVLITSDDLEWPGPKILFVNEALCRITGYAKDELMGQTPRMLQGPETDRDTLSMIRRELSAGRPCTAEVINHRRDGTAYTAELFITPLFDEQRRRRNFVSIHRDISVRKRTEQALRASEERYSLVTRAAFVGIWDCDLIHQTVTWNETYDRQFGPRPTDSFDSWQWWIDRIHPDDCERVVNEVRAAIAGTAATWRAEYRFRKSDGSYADLIDQATILRDETGKPLRILGAMRDVTEHKASENAVRASEARLQGLLDNTIAVVYIKALDGRYLTINRRFEEIFRLKSDQVIGHIDEEIHLPEVVEKIRANDHLVERTGRPLEFEEVVHHYDGPRTYISVKFPIFAADGSVAAVGGISTDITERKQAADLLRAESESLRRTIEFQDHERQLVAYDLHDGLMQYAAGALMRLDALEGRPEAQPLENELQAASGLLRKLLAEGRRIMNGIRTPVLDDAGAVSAIQQLIDEEERAHSPIEFVADENFGRLAAKTEEALYRIAQEALTNAIKHSQAKRVRIELRRRGDRAVLEVQDWGVGFDRRQPSIGVHGLRGMAERAGIAGGTCTIESTLGEGTRIKADLPCVPREA